MGESTPTIEDIIQAVNASGYLMEQQVATTLESLGYVTKTSFPFRDPDEDKSREIDVRAYLRSVNDEQKKVSLFSDLYCECKNNENPFVFIKRDKNEHDNLFFKPCHFLFPWEHCGIPEPHVSRPHRFIKFGFNRSHYYYTEPSKAVQFCKIVRKNKGWAANHDGIYDSMFYPLAKAIVAATNESYLTRKPSQGSDWKHVHLYFPVVVLNSEIYEINSSETPPIPRSVSHVSFIRELRSKHVSGQFLVDFVTRNGLIDLVETRIKPFVKQAEAICLESSEALGARS